MAIYNKFFDFVEQLLSAKHDFTAAGHVFKVYLSNATPDATADTIKADLAEITIANGYDGGRDIGNTLSEAAGIATVTAPTDAVWTATGAGFGPLRYAAVYNDTQTTPAKPLVCWWDYGSSIANVALDETFTVDFGASLFTLQ